MFDRVTLSHLKVGRVVLVADPQHQVTQHPKPPKLLHGLQAPRGVCLHCVVQVSGSVHGRYCDGREIRVARGPSLSHRAMHSGSQSTSDFSSELNNNNKKGSVFAVFSEFEELPLGFIPSGSGFRLGESSFGPYFIKVPASRVPWWLHLASNGSRNPLMVQIPPLGIGDAGCAAALSIGHADRRQKSGMKCRELTRLAAQKHFQTPPSATRPCTHMTDSGGRIHKQRAPPTHFRVFLRGFDQKLNKILTSAGAAEQSAGGRRIRRGNAAFVQMPSDRRVQAPWSLLSSYVVNEGDKKTASVKT